jgi:hypothetical protein
MTNATAEMSKEKISTLSELEFNELRGDLYKSIKQIYGGMTGAAEYCECSIQQLRLVLKGTDEDLDVLIKAAEWLRLYRIKQSEKLQSFVEVSREALSMV